MTHTHTSSYELEICLMMTHITHTHAAMPMPMPILDCLHKHMFLFYVYRSISLARIRCYTQLAYLFHQCATSLLSRDGRIADCTVRQPGVEHPFSSMDYIIAVSKIQWKNSVSNIKGLNIFPSLGIIYLLCHIQYFNMNQDKEC